MLSRKWIPVIAGKEFPERPFRKIRASQIPDFVRGGVTVISATMRRAAMVGALIAAATVLLTAPAAVASTTPSWAHRTLAVETLSHFRVVITATRDGGNPPRATVTAT